MGQLISLFGYDVAATVLDIDYSHGKIYARCHLTEEVLELVWSGRLIKSRGDYVYYNIKEHRVSVRSLTK